VRFTRAARSGEFGPGAARPRIRDDPQSEAAFRVALNRAVVIQSGGLQILDGKLIAGQGTEPERPARRQQARRVNQTPEPDAVHAVARPFVARAFAARPSTERALFDFVIPDDLIVQGSACVGLDCVDGEAFGFDTIKLKENNLRIKLEDRASRRFRPTIGSSRRMTASGGLSKFRLMTSPAPDATVEAGTLTTWCIWTAPVGWGSAWRRRCRPSHNTGNTPAIRFGTNASGASVADRDIGANEANWFVRDVTSGRACRCVSVLARRRAASTSRRRQCRHGTSSQTQPTYPHGNRRHVRRHRPEPGGTSPTRGDESGHGAASFGRGAGFVNVRPTRRGCAEPSPASDRERGG
jgi:hypothetical protein